MPQPTTPEKLAQYRLEQTIELLNKITGLCEWSWDIQRPGQDAANKVTPKNFAQVAIDTGADINRIMLEWAHTEAEYLARGWRDYCAE